MSYLVLPEGLPDFSKAVISLWFRVPQDSLDAAAAQPVPPELEGDINDYFPALHQVIPLLTFGSLETATTDLGYGSGAYPVAPSFIGVDCSPKAVTINTLAVHLSMSNNSTFVMTPMASDGAPLDHPQNIDTLQRPDAFYMGGFGRHPYLGTDQSALEVTPDHWHHVMLSFDLTIPAVMNYSTAAAAGSIKPITMPLGGPTFMWAFDDVDKSDLSLSPSCAQLYNILPPGSTFTSPTIPLTQITTNNLALMGGGSSAFVGTWGPVPVETEGNPVALPASTMFVENIYPVEMAELQFFTGVTMDTSIVDNRRVFVDADGVPVPPIEKQKIDQETGEPVFDAEGKPVMDPPPAEQLLGKKPDILLHGSGNWIVGRNTGPPKVPDPDMPGDPDAPLVPDPDKALTPTGKIISYSPGPSLHGEQSPP